METFHNKQGYKRIFKENKLTLGLFIPIEAYSGSIPSMEKHIQMAQKAEELGFGALWVRDIPLFDPYFGDVGQIYDPWVYLGYLTAHTKKITLGTGSIVFPLRHPIHLAKAATSIDQLSKGRLVLGIASGDRQVEFPAFNINIPSRGEAFRETYYYFKQLLNEDFPMIDSQVGQIHRNAGVLPKPYHSDIPLIITGSSRQPFDWIAENGDGWMYYPRSIHQQSLSVQAWREATSTFKPFLQSLYIDLTEDPDTEPSPIHLGFRLGRKHLIHFLKSLEKIGVNHVMLNLKYGQRDAEKVMEELANEVLPHFPSFD